jgi:hypothetical protein
MLIICLELSYYPRLCSPSPGATDAGLHMHALASRVPDLAQRRRENACATATSTQLPTRVVAARGREAATAALAVAGRGRRRRGHAGPCGLLQGVPVCGGCEKPVSRSLCGAHVDSLAVAHF